jgi:ankyrin repeat protein
VDDAGASARVAGGKTALHIAVQAGHAAVVLTLLQHGADVTAVDAVGDTALRMCLNSGAKAAVCCSMLLEAGSDARNVAAESRYEAVHSCITYAHADQACLSEWCSAQVHCTCLARSNQSFLARFIHLYAHRSLALMVSYCNVRNY